MPVQQALARHGHVELVHADMAYYWSAFNEILDALELKSPLVEGSILGDIYIGSFSYNQTTRKPKTYVRLNKEKDVFAVEGYLSMTFNRDLNGLRNKSIFGAFIKIQGV